MNRPWTNKTSVEAEAEAEAVLPTTSASAGESAALAGPNLGISQVDWPHTFELTEKGTLQTNSKSVVILLKCDDYGRPQDHPVLRRCQSVRVSVLSRVKGECCIEPIQMKNSPDDVDIYSIIELPYICQVRCELRAYISGWFDECLQQHASH